MKDKAQSPKTNAGPWWRLDSRLTHNRLFRAGSLLRRSGPVPGILAAPRPGAIVDKSECPFRCSFPVTPQSIPDFTQANNLKTCNLKT
jgi:hypothetical protein